LIDAHRLFPTLLHGGERRVCLACRVAGVARVNQERVTGGSVASYRLETVPDANPRAEVAAAVIGGGFKLLELQSQGLSLEDIFLRVISGGREAV
jgi:hypothetical protein